VAGAVEQLRAAVVSQLNAAGVAAFGALWVPAVSEWFDVTQQDDGSLKISVLPDGKRTSRETRGSRRLEVDLIVHVTKGLAGDTIAEVDALCEMLEAVERYYYTAVGTTSPWATLQSSSLQLPTRKSLNKLRRFYGFARLTFTMMEK
jgi:hypothetical protein